MAMDREIVKRVDLDYFNRSIFEDFFPLRKEINHRINHFFVTLVMSANILLLTFYSHFRCYA